MRTLSLLVPFQDIMTKKPIAEMVMTRTRYVAQYVTQITHHVPILVTGRKTQDFFVTNHLSVT